MPSPSRVLASVPLLCMLATLTGCRVPQPPQSRTEGLIIDLGKVKAGKRAVEVNVKITNDHDLPVSFDLGDVRLLCGNNVEVSPTPPRGNVQRVEIQQKSFKDFRWIFPLSVDLAPGSYTVEIKSFKKVDIEQPNNPEFQINV